MIIFPIGISEFFYFIAIHNRDLIIGVEKAWIWHPIGSKIRNQHSGVCVSMVFMVFKTTVVLCAKSQNSFVSACGTCRVSNSIATHIEYVSVFQCLDLRAEERRVVRHEKPPLWREASALERGQLASST